MAREHLVALRQPDEARIQAIGRELFDRVNRESASGSGFLYLDYLIERADGAGRRRTDPLPNSELS